MEKIIYKRYTVEDYSNFGYVKCVCFYYVDVIFVWMNALAMVQVAVQDASFQFLWLDG